MRKYTIGVIFTIYFFASFMDVTAYNLRQISSKEGLSNSAILSIGQDKDGFMWFGSCDGLNMFNGLNIQIYKPSNEQNDLAGNLIENVIEAEEGTLWIHTNYGLNKLVKPVGRIDTFTQFKGIYHIQKDQYNNIFIIKEDNSIYYYNKKEKDFEKISLENSKYSNILNFIITPNNELLIFAKDRGSVIYTINYKEDGGIELQERKALDQEEELLYCFSEHDNNHIIYIIDDTYTLYEYDFNLKKKYYKCNLQNEIEQRGEISSIVKHHSDFFIGFKTNGLLRLKNTPEKVESYCIEEIEIRSGVFCLLKDKYQDIVWVGTDGQGVFMYSNDPYAIKSTTLGSLAENGEKPVRTLYLDIENTLWIGTKGDGIIKIRDYDFNQHPSKFTLEYNNTANSALAHNSVYSFAESKKNIFWIGCETGLNYYSYRDKAIKKIDILSDEDPIKHIHAIYELNDSTLWLATVGMGVYRLAISGTKDVPVLKQISRFRLDESQGYQNYFFSILKENESSLWFGNRGYGAYKLDINTSRVDTLLLDSGKRQTLNDIFSIAKDVNNNFWFGTSFGLVKYQPNGEKVFFNENNGFPNNTIHGILSDSQNNLWLSTNRGIINLNIEQNNFQTYSALDGIQVIEYSDGAYYKDEKSGILFFGGINGFTSIMETGYSPQEYLPDIQFNDLMIFGEKKNIFSFLKTDEQSKILELNYDQNLFSVSFVALDYINGNNYTYYYKLGELSDQWIDNGTSNSVSFTSLAPGEYSLDIKYMNRMTGKESPEYSIIIKIHPPWYMSTFAYVVYALLILSVIALLIRAAIIRDKKKKYRALMKLKQRHQEEVYESKLSFFTKIAHEFCTPLTLIYGPCNRILTHNGSDQFVKKYTLLIQKNAERLNDMIQELIEFRRIETGNKSLEIENLSISEIAHNINESFNELAESKNIHFENDIEDELFWNTDKNSIYTILTNLISNAFKYTANNGFILVKIYKEDENLKILVSNTGKGIKEEDITKIFDRYTILDNLENKENNKFSFRNGLGLAISHNMVKLLGGTIEVDSVLNKKTDFIITLPQRDDISQNSEKKHSLPETSYKKDYEPIVELPEYTFNKLKPTIFIIDNDLEILWFISEIFEEEYNVIPINEPLNMEELLMQFHPNIIISDVMMPGIDGITLVKQLKANKNTAHIPLILISAKSTVEEQIEGMASGAEMYITKPFNIDYLRTSVQHLISRKESLKDYFSSPLSAFDLEKGKMTHKEDIKFTKEILSIIEKNILDQKLSAQFIAAELNMSPRHLYRKLKEIGTESPADMIRESRLHIARNLLLNTQMTIDEVINKSGFSNRATFFRQFSKKFECTPKEYRDKEISNM